MIFTKLEIKTELNKFIVNFYKSFKFCHHGNNYNRDRISKDNLLLISFTVKF